MALAAVVALSLTLRIYALGTESYWIDEMVSLHFAKHQDWRSIFWDNCPFLYHLVLKGWVAVVGDSETATRGLSVVFSLLATGAMIAIGRHLDGARGALACGLLHAVSNVSISYAQETRMYAMFEFFAALNLLGWLRLSAGGGAPAIRLYTLSSVMMALSHYLAAIPLLLQLACLGYRHRARVHREKAAISASVALVMLGVSFHFFFQGKYLNWQVFKFKMQPESRWPLELGWGFANQSWLGVAGLVALLAAAALQKRDYRRELALFAFVPVAAFTLAGLVISRAMLLPRYFIYVLPPLLALAAQALSKTEDRRLRGFATVALAVFLGGAAVSFNELYAIKKAPWREVAQIVAAYPDSLVLTTKTDAVQTPYFVNAGVRLRRWDWRNHQELLDEVKRNKHVWIVDNYWSFTNYYSKVLPEISAHVVPHEQTVQTGKQEPLFVVRFEQKL